MFSHSRVAKLHFLFNEILAEELLDREWTDDLLWVDTSMGDEMFIEMCAQRSNASLLVRSDILISDT